MKYVERCRLKYMKLLDVLETAPNDKAIVESLVMTEAKLRQYDKILCSISGGSDSDIMLDLCEKFNEDNKITYAFFDTGLEFAATKRHIEYLKQKYDIDIIIVKAEKAIPTCCAEYGQPFLSKQVSEWIARLQRHNFQWEDEPFDILYKKYPKCKAALRWWCNDFEKDNDSSKSRFNINYNQYLKEFMVANPPEFKISNKCCYYAKKRPAQKYKEENEFDLNMYGVRKAEGGARGTAYKTCFSTKEDGVDEYRPIFWYLNQDKEIYEKHYEIKHSDCYDKYGLKRTGCAGCPYGRNFEEELAIMQKNEPNLHKAVCVIFKDSYEYTRKYKAFVGKKNNK